MDTKPLTPNFLDEDWENYQPMRLLRYLADPSELQKKRCGHELEVSQRAIDFYGASGGYCIPPRPKFRAPPMDTVGTIALVGQDVKIAPGFVELIAQTPRVVQLGANVITGLRANVSFGQPTSVTVTNVAEDLPPADSEVGNETVSINLTESIQVNVPITRKLQVQSVPMADRFVEDAVRRAIAARIDAGSFAAAHAAASSQTGAGYTQMVAGEKQLLDNEVNITGVLAGADVWAVWRGATPDVSVIHSDLNGGHLVLDYRAYPVGSIGTSEMCMGDWTKLVTGFFGPLMVMRGTRVADAPKGQVLMHFEQSVGYGVMDGAKAFVKE